ncbi:transcriptional regulator [Chryseomicrobium excrementi]|uniref:Transcriptional regulator n=1 Tax=Chryseomicrobium excrementi TaxID=2041346 RepID=A0A2M9EYZ7_9BACL|nr:PLD nuclease N-terminal domain-containing protein [Chryseomicrobium excrementi]PJK16437.1 transcriptional regulator [Chryseomicrobium excrementi]
MEAALTDIPWALVAPIILLQFILLLVALIDLVRIPATNGPKWLWALIIVFGNIIGPIVYFIVGRRTQ